MQRGHHMRDSLRDDGSAVTVTCVCPSKQHGQRASASASPVACRIHGDPRTRAAAQGGAARAGGAAAAARRRPDAFPFGDRRSSAERRRRWAWPVAVQGLTYRIPRRRSPAPATKKFK